MLSVAPGLNVPMFTGGAWENPVFGNSGRDSNMHFVGGKLEAGFGLFCSAI